MWGASVKKRPKTSSRTVTDDDSEIIERVRGIARNVSQKKNLKSSHSFLKSNKSIFEIC